MSLWNEKGLRLRMDDGAESSTITDLLRVMCGDDDVPDSGWVVRIDGTDYQLIGFGYDPETDETTLLANPWSDVVSEQNEDPRNYVKIIVGSIEEMLVY